MRATGGSGCAGQELPVLLERATEIDQLQVVIDAAAAGHGRLAIVEGSAGIGKSSLLAATSQQASTAGLRILRARGQELEQEFPFGVVLQVLDPVVRRADAQEREVLFEGAGGLVRHLFERAAVGMQEPGPEQEFATLYGLYWLLAGVAEQGPVLVVIDDLQWVDQPSLRFVEFLVPRLEGLSVGVLIGTRPLQQRVKAELMVHAPVLVRPQPLSVEAVAQVVSRRLGVDEPALALACWHATGGVPFYVHALVDELAEQMHSRGALPGPEAVSALSPPAVSLTLVRRLSELPSPADAVAQAAAVLGDHASRADVAAVLGLTAGEVAEAVKALVATHLLTVGKGLSYAHPIARTAVYTEIPVGRREDLHSSAAGILGERGAEAQEIAAHILPTVEGAVAGARQILESAAREALRQGAPEVAVTYLRRALHEPEQGRTAQESSTSALALLLAQAAVRACQPEAEKYLRQAITVAPSGAQRVEVTVELARWKTATGHSAEAIAALVECAHACAVGERGVLARVRAELLAIGDIDLVVRATALDAAQEVAQLGRGLVEDSGLAMSVEAGLVDEAVGAMLRAHEAVEATLACRPAEEAIVPARAALAGGALISAGVGGVQLSFLAAYILTCADQFAEAEPFFTHVMGTSRSTGSVTGFASAMVWHSTITYRRGELAVAEADARTSLEAARANGLQLVEMTAVSLLSWILIDRGAPQKALAQFQHLSGDPRALPTFQAASALAARGKARIAVGEDKTGVEDLLEAGRRITATGMDNPATFAWRTDLVPGLLRLGRDAYARELVDEEAALARQWAAPRALGIALRTQGLLSDGDTRLDRLNEAVTVLEHSPAALERARALIELGATHRRAGHRREARPLLQRGAELAQACGARAEAARARTELRAVGGRARAPRRTGLDDLTVSEHRIATLAATGATNRQIAQDLFITTKTVEMHLSGAYRKLGITHRTNLPEALTPPPSGDRGD